MRARIAFFFATALSPVQAYADVILACTFDTLPQIIMTYPADRSLKPTMAVGGRPASEMDVGQGTDRFESANVDGYHFRFSPANMVMDVERANELVVSETARCATINGPSNDTPLAIAAGDIAEVEPEETAAKDDPKSVGSWDVSSDKSALDDTQTHIARLESDTVLAGQYGGTTSPSLILRCMENTTSAYIVIADFFLSDIQGYGDVTYRIDQKKAATKSMSASTDNHALGLWSGRGAIPFIKELLGGTKMVVRLTPYSDTPREFEFTLTGVDEAVVDLRATCKW